MLNLINKRFLLFSFLLYIVILPSITIEVLPIFIINFLILFSYVVVVFEYSNKNSIGYNIRRLRISVFLYSFIMVFVLNLLSFSYEGNFFVFSTRDALFYHLESIRINSTGFLAGIENYLKDYSYEDLGAVLFISIVYFFIESNLAVNFIYIILGVMTAGFIFSISLNFMQRKFAFLAAVTYSISSFVLWFHSSGLKESVMVTLVVGFYFFYYSFVNKREVWKLVTLILFALLLLLFRPPIMFFCIISVAFSSLLLKRKSMINYFLFATMLAIILFFSTVWEYSYMRFLYSGDINMLIDSREASGLVKESFGFTLFVNILSQFIGPLPTISPVNVKHLSIFSSGLIYRVLLAIPFWYGVYFIFKLKEKKIYPLLIFVFIEMFSLVLLLEGLELRKSLLHFPMIYIIAFWFLSIIESNTIKNKKLIIKTFKLASIFVLLIIAYWNYR